MEKGGYWPCRCCTCYYVLRKCKRPFIIVCYTGYVVTSNWLTSCLILSDCGTGTRYRIPLETWTFFYLWLTVTMTHHRIDLHCSYTPFRQFNNEAFVLATKHLYLYFIELKWNFAVNMLTNLKSKHNNYSMNLLLTLKIITCYQAITVQHSLIINELVMTNNIHLLFCYCYCNLFTPIQLA